MKEILSVSIPLLLFSPVSVFRTLVAACSANISLSNLKLSVNCCDERSLLYTGPAQCGCSVLERELLHTKGLSHPVSVLGGTPSILFFWRQETIFGVFLTTEENCFGLQRRFKINLLLIYKK